MSEVGAVGMAEILRLLASLAFVVGVLVLIGHVLRRRMPGRRTRSLEVEERLVLGKGAQLLIVGVQGRRMLVGMSEGSIHLISELDRQEIEKAQESRPSPMRSVRAFFRKKNWDGEDELPLPNRGAGDSALGKCFEIAMRQAQGRRSEADR